ncbi:hypothetical protein GCM10010466_29390 [Planomonospora alba]|uniref:Minor tail protein n=1 Tax=Planomonospora alba TaxID=161354 RepID=A0ABP6N516_9ACTN
MAERSFPFDGGSGSVITENDWSMLTQNWQDSGVIANDFSDTALTVTTLGETGKIYVQPGQATIRGFHYVNESALALTVPQNTDSQYERIDLVVVRLDKATNAVRAYLKVGTPASTPVPPTVDRSFDSPEIPLARVTVPASSSTIPVGSGRIADVREFIGKRVRITNDPGSLPLGSIAYRPSEDKFYGVKTAGATELGAGSSGGGGTPTGGGVTICTVDTRPPSPTEGQQIYETDSHRYLVWSGTAWVPVSFSPMMVRRRYLGPQSINLLTAGTFYPVEFSHWDYDVVPPGWDSWTVDSDESWMSYPPGSLRGESFWHLEFACEITNPSAGVIYHAQIFSGTTDYNVYTQSVTSTSTSPLHLSVSADIRIRAGLSQGTYAQLARTGGSSGGIEVRDARYSIRRTG